ncbi:MAG: hypothetical protein J6P98_07965 [Clostridia bacterium]|nr:hypothetical protein [Clostridia bacterium]
MKPIKRILAAVVAAITVAVVFVRLPLPDMREAEAEQAPPPAAVSRFWREAEKIALATCMRNVERADGSVLSRFRVDESLEGGLETGGILSIPCLAEPGSKFLLYLRSVGEGEEAGYELVTDQPLPVVGSRVEFEGEHYGLESIVADIERQRSILTVPSQSFFYGSIEGLAAACDEIVIARVLSVSDPEETVCRSADKGESTLMTVEQVFMRIKVENGLSGGLAYGEKLSVVLEPYNVRPVINATNLSPKTVGAPPESAPKVGSVYIFFLIRSADKKSSYYFTVNPYEGCVLLLGNSVIHPYYNIAFRETNDLRRFVERLKAAREGE